MDPFHRSVNITVHVLHHPVKHQARHPQIHRYGDFSLFIRRWLREYRWVWECRFRETLLTDVNIVDAATAHALECDGADSMGKLYRMRSEDCADTDFAAKKPASTTGMSEHALVPQNPSGDT